MPVDFPALFRCFLRIGFLSFGGPAAQIALMHQELVEKRKWLNEDSFLRGLSFCMLLPGPEAMQLATYIGWRLKGTVGGLIAGLLFVLPGSLVISLLLFAYVSYHDTSWAEGAFLGIKAAVVAIILKALIGLSRKALNGSIDILIAGMALLALFLFGLPFPVVILAAGSIGFFVRHTQANYEQKLTVHITPRIRAILSWAALWLIPLILLSIVGAPFLAAIGWFFAKLAVVSFGGAYATLAYMSQTVVSQQEWINQGQLLDALGLAETTPGPLVLVTQFIAMLAGHIEGGWDSAFAAGLIALWATFIPCFLWIFAAAPYVETLTEHPRIGPALQSISACIVGVIANLAMWFLISLIFRHVSTVEFGAMSLLWPDMSSVDPIALLLVSVAPMILWVVKGSLWLFLPLMAIVSLLLQ
ncbi:chromate transporter [Epibacterium ulvae]|uniref:Chromate transporter n=1 Tax=Epibacterium ulvae TaxID=1156985 RepID=A0A1G5QAF1_9RHOB|nr:chromate efflux transporter [Epibacterium ulvae]SCZ58546.1 chromate transporter [Epibacterium ulvae]